MKNKLFFSGILGILLIFALFVGCDNGSTTTEIVEVTVEGPVTTTTAPPVVTEVPSQNFTALINALVDAEEAIREHPETPQEIEITGQIPIPANNTITVPDYVTLRIKKGGRLTVEANAILYVRQYAALEVAAGGEMYFEQYANGDDVRQAKIVGKFIVNGGTVYDKSTDGRQLQYVTSIKEGGRLVFAGGTAVQGRHETNLLGTPSFTGTGEIRLVFSDGWSKYNPVVPVPGTSTIITRAVAPTFDGFEIIGEIEITGDQLTIPDNNARPIKGIVRRDAKLKIGKNASFMSEYAAPADAGILLVEEGAGVEVEGRLEIPNQAGNANRGLITVKAGGTLLNGEDTSPTIFSNLVKVGTMVFEKGALAMVNRANPVPWASPGGSGDIKTNSTQITLTDTSLAFKDGGADWITPIIAASLPATLTTITLDKAAVNFKDAVTLGAGQTLSATNGSKVVFDKPLTANTGTVTANASEVTFDVSAVNPPLNINLTNRSTGIFDFKGAAVTFPPASTTVTVDSKDSTISYLGSQTLAIGNGTLAAVTAFLRNAGLKFGMPVEVTTGGLAFNNVKAEFNKGLEIQGAGMDLELDNNTALTVDGRLVMTNGNVLINRSTAGLETVTITNAGTGIALTNAGVVTLNGALTYAAAGTLGLDSTSSLKGPAGNTTGVARIIADGLVTVTIPAFTASDEEPYSAWLPGITANLAALSAKTWDGTYWK